MHGNLFSNTLYTSLHWKIFKHGHLKILLFLCLKPVRFESAADQTEIRRLPIQITIRFQEWAGTKEINYYLIEIWAGNPIIPSPVPVPKSPPVPVPIPNPYFPVRSAGSSPDVRRVFVGLSAGFLDISEHLADIRWTFGGHSVDTRRTSGELPADPSGRQGIGNDGNYSSCFSSR